MLNNKKWWLTPIIVVLSGCRAARAVGPAASPHLHAVLIRSVVNRFRCG
jgi:hypothetical protein